MNLTKSMMMLAAGAMLLPLAAQAEQKPTLVVLHKNILNQNDEATWQDLANSLSQDGYRVVSVALRPEETAAQGRDQVVKLLSDSPEYGKVVLVGTAAASDALSMTAEADAARVKALVYVSAEPSVATLGPRTVSEPNDLVGKVPSFQIKITNGKRTDLNEKGATMLRVRENGKSTVARVDDMTSAIEICATGRAAYHEHGYNGYWS
jgi:hypothetical protein